MQNTLLKFWSEQFWVFFPNSVDNFDPNQGMEVFLVARIFDLLISVVQNVAISLEPIDYIKLREQRDIFYEQSKQNECIYILLFRVCVEAVRVFLEVGDSSLDEV